MDITDLDCMATLCKNRLVRNSDYYPIPCLTITICCPTCLIPKYIKFGVIFEKIDIVNKASTYVIKFVACIVTVLSYLCCCVVVAYFFDYFYLWPALIVHTLYNVTILVRNHPPAVINCSTGSTLDTIPYNESIAAKNQESSQV